MKNLVRMKKIFTHYNSRATYLKTSVVCSHLILDPVFFKDVN